MKRTPSERYAELVGSGEIRRDEAQADLARRLGALAAAIDSGKRDGALGRLLRRRAAVPRGLYIHGDVGRGKTMLADLFIEALATPSKRRAHFHDFMADVHERVHEWRKRPLRNGRARDPIAPVAADLFAQARVLCLDEFHVHDIADAMILGRLFTALFARGLVLVATSNTPPGGLYAGGLNRQLFLPFISLLSERVEVVRLDAERDFRLEKLRAADVWFAAGARDAPARMDDAWRRLAGTVEGEPVQLHLKGRQLTVPQAHLGVARFSFSQLCEAPLGTNDFLALARNFHTVLVDGIPSMAGSGQNPVRRFIVLVDTFYDHRVKLVASAAAEPDDLYPSGPLAAEFRRTASRLHEMRGDAYLAAAHGAPGSQGAGSITERAGFS